MKINIFCTKTELLDIVGSRLVSNGLTFSDGIAVDIQLVTFLLLSNIRELSIGVKTRTF